MEVHSTGFYRNKAKSIKKMSGELMEKHAGEVPATMKELTALAGVGRKTANVILGNCFGEPAIVIDTHAKRMSGRLGLSEQSNPDKIEADLQTLLPRENWWHFCNGLVWHGRKCCSARKPACDSCALSELCPSAGKV